MIRFFSYVFVIASLLAGDPVAEAAGLKARGETAPEQATNPAPAPMDLELPMPCGLSMIMAPIDVPVQGFLWDVPFSMGTDTSDRPGMEYYDRRFAQSISGPFSPADLPEAWRKKLPEPASGTNIQYYFMGKYEVSTLQWKAVMEGSCPATVTQADSLPKTEVSWYDAIEFSRRYNEWLLANAADKLPHFHNDAKNIGYVRLPTEAEWEFAARGGSRVAPDVLRQQDFYPLEPGSTLEDYAVYRPENAARILDAPQRIGSRKPNPLGLHDMAGNVAEIMLDTFHFSLGNRLHGSAGGVVRKGGGFSASRDEIMPGRREEMPLYHARGPAVSRDTGFRLALSGVNTPDGGRTSTLKKEWAALGERSGEIVPGANPLQEIDRILNLTQDPTAKKNLETLRGAIKDFNISLEQEKDSAAEGLLRSSIYMLETIRNYAVRLNISRDRVKAHEDENKKVADTKGKVYLARRQLIDQYEQVAASCLEAIQASTLFYKARLSDLAAIPDKAYAHHRALLEKEFSGSGVFRANMTDNLKTLDRHRSMAKKGQAAGLTVPKLQQDILPDTLRLHVR